MSVRRLVLLSMLIVAFACNLGLLLFGNARAGLLQTLKLSEQVNTPAEQPSYFQQRKGRATGNPLPRFVSLKRDKVNMRSGPAQFYKISWVYQKRNLPVQIIDEYQYWRKIRDFDGSEGWVHSIMLSGKRTALVRADHSQLFRDQARSKAISQLESGVVLELVSCSLNECHVKHPETEGWMSKNALWGVQQNDIF